MVINEEYTSVPPGKIASVVTFLEMRKRPSGALPKGRAEWNLFHKIRPDISWYRKLYRLVGEQWLWFSRLILTDSELSTIVHDPQVMIYAFQVEGQDAGLLELDFRQTGACELAFFGLMAQVIGCGAGRWLMSQAIEFAWARPIERFLVHTCTLDHPQALEFYIRSGFTPYRRQVEVADDPRLNGTLAREAAPRIPIIVAS